MITTDDVRRLATALPAVEEFTHFRFKVPGWRVDGSAFAGMDRGEATAVFSVSADEAAAAVWANPAVYQEVWRPGARRSLVGVRVDLARVGEERIRELLDHAWRHKAPKRLVAAHDAAAAPG